MTVEIRVGDCRELLRAMPAESVNTCVTSPPYFGLRDYGHDGQIGLEETPEQFVAALVDVFREVRRVLREDGTVWLNLGDSYAGSGKGGHTPEMLSENWKPEYGHKGKRYGLKAKDLIGIPWRVAFALQADGCFLRQDIIWHKPNQMPESVRDRCTKAHEYIFLLSKSAQYHFDADAICEPVQCDRPASRKAKKAGYGRKEIAQRGGAYDGEGETRNRRSVWSISTQPYSGAHFATFPPALVEPCIMAGCPAGGTVLDPFGGAGTTGLVADRMGRHAVLLELNPDYAALARKRIEGDGGMFSQVVAA